MTDIPFEDCVYAEGKKFVLISFCQRKSLVLFVYVSKAERQSLNGYAHFFLFLTKTNHFIWIDLHFEQGRFTK